MENKAKEIIMVPVNEITPNEKNRNKHSPEQIERLKKIIEYQGFRSPLLVSKRTGRLVAGHGRLLAAKALGISDVPVMYQNFESEEEEYAAGVSDNSIASWAELDLSGINSDLEELGPFDVDILGIDNFKVDVSELDNNEVKQKTKTKQCPSCGHCF